MAIKPRIKLLSRANWQCADDHVARCGKNWKQAYDRWLSASLRHALEPRVEKAAKPVKYHESMVQKLHGTVARPQYVPTPGLRINIERASKCQRPLTTQKNTGNGYVHPKERYRS